MPKIIRAILLVGCIMIASDMPQFEFGDWSMMMIRLVMYNGALLMAYLAL
jgi:hypothetical protein